MTENSYTWQIENARGFRKHKVNNYVKHIFKFHGESWRLVFFPYKIGGATIALACLSNNIVTSSVVIQFETTDFLSGRYFYKKEYKLRI